VQFSRPMTGHTPQKLPPFDAISCIIAVRWAEFPLHALDYHITQSSVCQQLFWKKSQFSLLFSVKPPEAFFRRHVTDD